ncbi:heparan-alpha-glucosaminide N-acetyltransferase domain-containing protein [Chitinophaga solisilvae]|uniref:heparan-alpha-glucosaminide N-acetyltransferase domain-containing protein n=1 Tax=Chitinophaga solisilvae TaxID=1233460 RepID=UPI00136A3D2E|nr:heparan-alpha-glucosaminide N-acetyltransferase domain-containing protein [Chitinophaga solisilvae]
MRIPAIDMARGFTVFIMTAVHTLLLYSEPAVFSAATGRLFTFLSEAPGAPVFMTAMGVSFVFSSQRHIRSACRRAAILLMLGYLLNTLKFLVPVAAGSMPPALLADFGIPSGSAAVWHFLLMGDILHLAAISLVVLSLVYRLPHYAYMAAILAFAVALTAPLLWGIRSEDPVSDYLLALLWGNDSRVFFPVFPWLTYPLLGLTVGYYLQHHPAKAFIWCRNAGLLLMIAGMVISARHPEYHRGDFYRAAQGGTLYYAGFVLCWLYGWHLAVRWIPAHPFFHLLGWLSKNITSIYLLQWTLIFWMLPVAGYRQLNGWQTWLSMIMMTLLVMGVLLLLKRIRWKAT